nr:MAG TPA: hypothetical protein [Caudoviricetes sp.]
MALLTKNADLIIKEGSSQYDLLPLIVASSAKLCVIFT